MVEGGGEYFPSGPLHLNVWKIARKTQHNKKKKEISTRSSAFNDQTNDKNIWFWCQICQNIWKAAKAAAYVTTDSNLYLSTQSYLISKTMLKQPF